MPTNSQSQLTYEQFIDGNLRVDYKDSVTIASCWPRVNCKRLPKSNTNQATPKYNKKFSIYIDFKHYKEQPLQRSFFRYENKNDLSNPYIRYMENIPWKIRNFIRPFPEDHFNILKLISNDEYTLGLFQSNPALGFMLATSYNYRKEMGDENVFQESLLYVRDKRVKALTLLGFDQATQQTLRILQVVHL
tara:strand:+ start:1711 stop:2280 length:570 start_codon:yes stop_codon:yes gene_type:complete